MSEKRRSASAAADPFEAWREWIDRAERQLNTALADLMESERFGKSSARMIDLMVGFQSSMSAATQRYFSTLNLPTRGDVLQIGERLSSIEERLASLEEAVSTLAPAAARRSAPAAARPKRTRKPPAAAQPAPTVAAPAAAAPGGEKRAAGRVAKKVAKKAAKKAADGKPGARKTRAARPSR
jgi:hypothetical protein